MADCSVYHSIDHYSLAQWCRRFCRAATSSSCACRCLFCGTDNETENCERSFDSPKLQTTRMLWQRFSYPANDLKRCPMAKQRRKKLSRRTLENMWMVVLQLFWPVRSTKLHQSTVIFACETAFIPKHLSDASLTFEEKKMDELFTRLCDYANIMVTKAQTSGQRAEKCKNLMTHYKRGVADCGFRWHNAFSPLSANGGVAQYLASGVSYRPTLRSVNKETLYRLESTLWRCAGWNLPKTSIMQSSSKTNVHKSRITGPHQFVHRVLHPSYTNSQKRSSGSNNL